MTLKRRLPALLLTSALTAGGWAATAAAAPADRGGTPVDIRQDKDGEAGKPPHLMGDAAETDGSVAIAGRPVAYHAVVGTLVVHPKDWSEDQPGNADEARAPGAAEPTPGPAQKGSGTPSAEAAMSFVAYFAKGAASDRRPVTFVYNGGPGSSSLWLHMGAFGPRRVVTLDDSHTPAAPYRLVENGQSLLDVTDLVFIDAPGTGFGRLAGKDKEKAFWGADQDAEAFADFIARFLSRYGRWNSPKFLFGESYGTTRSALLANVLTNQRSIDLNGVIMLSQILDLGDSIDTPEDGPGDDRPYILALPSYAATAWYHHKLAAPPAALKPFLAEVEQYATTTYAQALMAGAALGDAARDAVAAKLHDYTGLPTDYIKRAGLRIDGGEFEHQLQLEDGLTTGRFDARFSGPALNPLAKDAEYDPQSTAIDSAYVSTFNDYVRHVLHYGGDRRYKDDTDADRHWDFTHQPPNEDHSLQRNLDVLPDLAAAMTANPTMKVMLNAGYFDLATPFFAGIYEMRHLPMAAALQANIEFRQYESGHMVYAHQQSLQALHDNVADFIRCNDNLHKG